MRAFLYRKFVRERFGFFFFNDTATTEIYTLSLHDALPISRPPIHRRLLPDPPPSSLWRRSEEHTSELQSQSNLVCRLLLEKKKGKQPFRREPDQLVACISQQDL